MVFCRRINNIKQKMPKKSQPLLQKVSTLLKSSIFIAKIRRPVIPRLFLLKKSWKVKKLMLQKHYNYKYIQEYEFSPSNTPLIMQYYRKPAVLKKRSYQDLYSMLFVCKCLGGALRSEDDEDRRSHSMELVALPSVEDDNAVVRELSAAEVFDSCSEDGYDDSVDERAEKFIERFYEEMRMQRQEALLLAY